MWAAIRYRRAQAVSLLLLAALVSACAAIAPLYTRALEQAQLRSAVDRADLSETLLQVSVNRTSPRFSTTGDGTLQMPSELEARVPAALAELHEPPIGSLSAAIRYQIFPGIGSTELSLRARDGICDHVTITEGRCPTRPGEIAVSAPDAARWRFPIGTVMPTAERGSSDYGNQLVVAGVYEQKPDDRYWLRVVLGGKSGATAPDGDVPALDDWITPESTFAKAWYNAAVTVQYILKRPALTLDTMPVARAGIAAITADDRSVTVSSPLDDVVERVAAGQAQVRLIVPLLMAQLGLLAVVVLASVCSAAVDQRRAEIALARLRGRGPRGALWLVGAELGLVVLAGVPVGLLIAFAVTASARWLVLPPGVPFELPALVWAAAALAGLVCLATVFGTAVPVIRQPISSLLRRIGPTRRAGALPLLDVITIALALAGLVGLATGTVTGPLAILTPTLLSLAVGLLATRLWVPLAAGGAVRALRRGSVTGALASWQVSRRPTLRKVLTIVTVATALAVFAVNADLVADRNRTYRAELEAGAPVVLTVTSTDAVGVRAALTTIDPSGTRAMPVVVVRQRDPSAVTTLGVVPRLFQQVAFGPHDGSYDWAALAPPRTPTLRITGRTVSARVSSDVRVTRVEEPSRDVPAAEAEDAALTVALSVTYANGQQATRPFGAVPLAGGGSRAVTTSLLCPQPCRVDGILVQGTTADLQRDGTITITDLRVDGGSPLPIGDLSQWEAPPPGADGRSELTPLEASAGPTLRLQARNNGVRMRLGYADVPRSIPAFLAGSPPPGGTVGGFEAVGILGRPLRFRRVQAVPSVPVLGTNAVVADYDVMSAAGGAVQPGGTLEVWLDTTDPGAVAAVRGALADRGFATTTGRTFAELKARYDASASAWGLQLAVFVALLAVLMAGLVLVVVAVTSWRAVARDFAALAMAGLSRQRLASALTREQGLVVAVGALLGTACGVAGSWLAMPLVPLFDEPAVAPAADLAPAVLAVGGTALVVLVGLGVVALFVARSVARRISFDRIREQL